jgi:Tol biopolymer transport system component
MALTSGTRLGSYEIAAPIGAGGMGEVYRARDTRLNRDVALKVLPELFAADPDRLARFRREAQVLASLNHPNIAAIYGFEESGGVQALVLELVEGPTLADRIAQGPIPLDEALPIARQIAEALEAAHAHGVIHRDLKPANIKVRPDGTVKVLDFGLAKALEPDVVGAGLSRPDSMSPTITSPAATRLGVILGTAAYMSPEQARGKPVDKRSDIWGFGCVLYEMLTGERAFPGEGVMETLAAVIHEEPRWGSLPAHVPTRVRATLQQCLQKDPRQRLHDIGDVRLMLEGALDTHEPAGGRPSRSWRRAAELSAAAVAGVVVTGLALWTAGPPVPPTMSSIRFVLPAPDGYTFGNTAIPSPDGRHIVFQARDAAARTLLWLHSFQSGQSRPLPGTSTANTPWWSHDSRFIAFNNEGKLRRIDIAGGPPQTIADLSVGTSQGAWNHEGVIIFGQNPGPVMRVPASGGAPTPVTALDPSRQERAHTGPRFLPDGRHFVYARMSAAPEHSGIFIGSLDAAPEAQEQRMLVPSALSPGYAPSPDPRVGYLLYMRDGTLLARTLDNVTRQLVGDAVPVAEQVADNGLNTGFFGASGPDVLIYRHGASLDGRLMWVDRNGREAPFIEAELKQLEYPRLSPDGTRLAVTVARDVWIYDVGGRPPIKLTFNGGNISPLWTPDGRRVVYESATPVGILSIPADGSGGAPELISPPGHYHPHGWSADGRSLLAVRLGTPETGQDIVMIPLDRKEDAEPVVHTPAIEGGFGAALSPDGRWMAYVSDVTGQREVWVQPFPGPGAPIRVSPKGGVEPVWARNGRELFYLEGNTMMGVKVETVNGFRPGPPTALFEGPYLQFIQPPSYDVAADGRFLMVRPTDNGAANVPVTVILNWQETLSRPAERP